MKKPLSRPEWCLLVAALLGIATAAWGPSVAQYANYHAFADQRSLFGIAYAMDVLSNMPFAVFGIWGLLRLGRVRDAGAAGAGGPPRGAPTALAALFFVGLIVTAACSTFYHQQPDDLGLAIDRAGMVLAFAGLLGLAAADRISLRAGVCTGLLVLVAGPLAVGLWATTANLLPWSVVQGGGMLLLVVLSTRKPLDKAWRLPLWSMIACYALAKAFELGDHAIFDFTQGLVSGHTLKHLVAAMTAWPLIAVMQNGPHAQRMRGTTSASHASTKTQ